MAKVALITGGGRRIGAAIADCLHREGFNLVVHFRRSKEAAVALRERLEARRPDSVRLIHADLASAGAIDALMAETLGFWERLDVLVNNASAFYPTPLGSVTEVQWEELTASNLKAPFSLAQAAFPELRRRRGCIVNLADIYGLRPRKGYPVYSVAKAGLVALTRALALEMAPHVRVNAVAPGAILWPEGPLDEAEKQAVLAVIPLARMGRPEDIARAVRYLACEADYVTGQVLAVDGGRSL
ncbi:pteridine reductase [Methylomarinovum caldicuralii]|uniref:Pteridine reductase n=1 Tax=Methylomarinovum caldicuralii TaxID=438856 RepID=A0AAU9C1W7_9GAMM|nr:pteridine reductase [Methylomarinovum caldicuralii]BCX82352.1 pteridine reductase [Methylomarinovum caldicuralii]